MVPALLEVADLTVEYRSRRGSVAALRDVSLTLENGASLGIVGESGSGKSTLALAILGLLPKSATVTGSIRFDGTELLGARRRVLEGFRGRHIGLVYQDALVSLNPVRRVGSQIVEVIRRHDRDVSKSDARAAGVDALARVGITNPVERFDQYPHQFSGGMRQRAAIAMALAGQPRLLLADEITTALDVTVQAQILDLLTRLRSESGMATVVISHDLEVVHGVTSEVAVMYAGRVVESGPTDAVLSSARHPYTAGLVESGLTIEEPTISYIPGAPPIGGATSQGCAFEPRCAIGAGRDRCRRHVPALSAPDGDPARGAACHYIEELRSRRDQPLYTQ